MLSMVPGAQLMLIKHLFDEMSEYAQEALVWPSQV